MSDETQRSEGTEPGAPTAEGDERGHSFRKHQDGEIDHERATGEGRPRAENDPELESTFQSAVEEGTLRLRRSAPTLLATGLIGGIICRSASSR